MKKAVSLKVCLARTAGLLVLAAVAVAFLVAPMVAMGAKPKNPPVLKIKANFVGLVLSTPPSGSTFNVKDFKVGDTAFKLTLTKTVPFEQFKKGSWLFCDLKDPVSNQSYGFFAAVDTVDKVKKTVRVLIGTAGNPAMVSTAAVQKFQGKLAFLNFTVNKTNANNIDAIPPLPGTGWDLNQTA